MYQLVPKILLFYIKRIQLHTYVKIVCEFFGEATLSEEIYSSPIYNCIIPSNWDNLCQHVHENKHTPERMKRITRPPERTYKSSFQITLYEKLLFQHNFLTLNFKCVNNSEQTLKSLFQYHIMFP